MSFSPKKRYSAVVVLSEDLERVVLIHKLKPDWQAGKANVPGGKVDMEDVSEWLRSSPGFNWQTLSVDAALQAHRVCAARELREETNLDITATALKLFCRLRFRTPEGNAAECCFYAATGDVDAARTMEEEVVFIAELDSALCGFVFRDSFRSPNGAPFKLSPAQTAECPMLGDAVAVPTMPNIPYIVAMARQCMRGEGAGSWPLTIYEAGAAS